MSQTCYANKLLRSMAADDFQALQTHLEPHDLNRRQVIVHRNAVVTHVYFPESGQVSVLARASGSEPIEVSMFGREGMSCVAPSNRMSTDTIVQIEGHAHRIERETFLRAMQNSASLALFISRWSHAELMQTTYTALANGSFTVAQRLARYVLMIQDRLDGDEVPLAHDQFAWMLAVRRAGVTESFRELKRLGAVDTSRGKVRIVDREALIAAAKGSYGPAEADYERLFANASGAA
ncbi:MAG TPA: Crp/Fnr family transcriptional regulator [Beijerinckiaceae bacterium]